MAAWMETHRGVVFPWHCDQFGHMNVRWYAHFFDDAAFHIWPMLGFSLQQIEETFGVHTVVARTTTDFVKELKAGDLFRIETGVGRIGTKSLTYRQRMVHVDTGDTHATQDAVEVFFDPRSRQSAPVPDEMRPALQEHFVGEDG